jgi:hypothetical protein
MKLSVGKESRQAILAGAVVGVILSATNASAPIIYAATIIVGTAFCLFNEGRLEGISPFRRRR